MIEFSTYPVRKTKENLGYAFEDSVVLVEISSCKLDCTMRKIDNCLVPMLVNVGIQTL